MSNEKTSKEFNSLEKDLLVGLAQDCTNMPCEHESEREKGFFTCAGSMFAILEHHGLTSTTGNEFIASIDFAVTALSFKNGSTH